MNKQEQLDEIIRGARSKEPYGYWQEKSESNRRCNCRYDPRDRPGECTVCGGIKI